MSPAPFFFWGAAPLSRSCLERGRGDLIRAETEAMANAEAELGPTFVDFTAVAMAGFDWRFYQDSNPGRGLEIMSDDQLFTHFFENYFDSDYDVHFRNSHSRSEAWASMASTP